MENRKDYNLFFLIRGLFNIKPLRSSGWILNVTLYAGGSGISIEFCPSSKNLASSSMRVCGRVQRKTNAIREEDNFIYFIFLTLKFWWQRQRLD